MTDDTKQLVEELRDNAEWCKGNNELGPYLTLGGCMAMAADLIEKLSADLESDERQYGRDAFAVLTDEGAKLEADRDAWKRRCEAAEHDLVYMTPCETCKERPMLRAPACITCRTDIWDGWRRSGYVWRGPCEENGGGCAE